MSLLVLLNLMANLPSRTRLVVTAERGVITLRAEVGPWHWEHQCLPTNDPDHYGDVVRWARDCNAEWLAGYAKTAV